MTKKTTTKKSGTIAYQLRRQNDLTGTATEKNPQMAVTVVNSKLITTKELAEYIDFACSVYGIYPLGAGVLHQVHHRLIGVGVVECCDKALRLV